MSKRYTKADLQELVYAQLANLEAIHDLLRIIKLQNELIEQANKKLKSELQDVKVKLYPVAQRRKK